MNGTRTPHLDNRLPDFTTPMDFARRLKCSRAYVHQLIQRGILPAIKIGGLPGERGGIVRIKVADAEEFLRRAETKP